METKELAESFIDFVMLNFPNVRIKHPTTTRQNRISLYVPNRQRNKRWMQVDWNTNVLNIAMDHSAGDIAEEQINSLGITYGNFNGKDSRIRLNNNDAILISLFKYQPINLQSEEFLKFLKVHYNSYKKRVVFS